VLDILQIADVSRVLRFEPTDSTLKIIT